MTTPEPERRADQSSDTAIIESARLINRAAQTVANHGREDLVERLRLAHKRLSDPDIRVLVVGEYKKGKSLLVNAVVDASVCKVDCDTATAVPTAVRYADEPAAFVFPEADNGDGEPPPEPVALNDFHAYQAEGTARRIRLAEARLPRDVLRGGLVLVDTPGVGGLVSAHGTATAAALPMADAVLFVTDASQELTAPELEFLRTARELCPNILCVLTKTDMYPEWKRILELDREHLRRAAIDLPIGAVSSAMRMHALRAGDTDANTESGFPQLIRFLRERVVGAAEQILVGGATNDIEWSLSQLETALASERRALTDPERAGVVVAELERAKQRSTDLRDVGSRWQQALNDGVADLMTEVDHDLRSRFRELTRVADEAIDRSDPIDAWDEFEPWLYERMNADVTQNYAAMAAGAQQLATRVAAIFDADAPGEVGELMAEAPLETIGGTGVGLSAGSMKRSGLGAQGLTLFRSAYSGTFMFSMVGSMIGIALTMTNPVMLGLAAFMGGKGVRDARSREREQRRQKAKSAVRKFVDDVSFQVNKDKTDQLRRLHREVRDAFTARASELQRSASDALAAAQRSVQTDQETRRKRLKEVQDAIAATGAVRAEVQQLTQGPG